MQLKVKSFNIRGKKLDFNLIIFGFTSHAFTSIQSNYVQLVLFILTDAFL